MTEDGPIDSDNNDGGTGATTDSTAPTENATSPSTDYKVRGRKAAHDGTGVLGHNTASTGTSYGVEGQTDAAADPANGIHPAGVAGRATGSGATYGVYGRGASSDSMAILGDGTKSGGASVSNGYPTGVSGITDRTGADSGIYRAHGVLGITTASSGASYGVYGSSFSSDGVGVQGVDFDGNGFGVRSVGDTKTEGNHVVTGHVDAGTGFRGNVGASAYVGSSQSVAAGNSAVVQYDTIDVDDRSEFDPTNNEFVAAYAGDYHVNAVVEVGLVPPDERVQLEIYQQGSRRAVSKYYGPGTSDHRITLSVSKTLKGMPSGDSISVQLDNHTSSSLSITDVEHFSHIEVTQVA